MSDNTKIEWATTTWNPVTGCSQISEGCKNCYAKRMANRLRGRHGYPEDDPFKVTFHPDRLNQPLKWKKPRKIFVSSMGDLFHEDVWVDWIDSIIGIINQCKQHTFMALTKRPENIEEKLLAYYHNDKRRLFSSSFAIPPNLWLGVTAENQKRADERIPILLQIPARVRFISIEPMLERVSFRWSMYAHQATGETYREYLERNGSYNQYEALRQINWVICGPETGPGKRPFNVAWARDLRGQCRNAGVPFFMKGADKMPEDLRIEEFPE